MLHVTFSVRQTDIIPAAKTAMDKSKPTLNKNKLTDTDNESIVVIWKRSWKGG